MGVHRQPYRWSRLLERVRPAAAAPRVDGESLFTSYSRVKAPETDSASPARQQNFVAFNEFCIRACKDGPDAPRLCNHIYDVMGCEWNMPGNYGEGFDQCKGDTGEVRFALYSTSFHATGGGRSRLS